MTRSLAARYNPRLPLSFQIHVLGAHQSKCYSDYIVELEIGCYPITTSRALRARFETANLACDYGSRVVARLLRWNELVGERR